MNRSRTGRSTPSSTKKGKKATKYRNKRAACAEIFSFFPKDVNISDELNVSDSDSPHELSFQHFSPKSRLKKSMEIGLEAFELLKGFPQDDRPCTSAVLDASSWLDASAHSTPSRRVGAPQTSRFGLEEEAASCYTTQRDEEDGSLQSDSPVVVNKPPLDTSTPLVGAEQKNRQSCRSAVMNNSMDDSDLDIILVSAAIPVVDAAEKRPLPSARRTPPSTSNDGARRVNHPNDSMDDTDLDIILVSAAMPVVDAAEKRPPPSVRRPPPTASYNGARRVSHMNDSMDDPETNILLADICTQTSGTSSTTTGNRAVCGLAGVEEEEPEDGDDDILILEPTTSHDVPSIIAEPRRAVPNAASNASGTPRLRRYTSDATALETSPKSSRRCSLPESATRMRRHRSLLDELRETTRSNNSVAENNLICGGISANKYALNNIKLSVEAPKSTFSANVGANSFASRLPEITQKANNNVGEEAARRTGNVCISCPTSSSSSSSSTNPRRSNNPINPSANNFKNTTVANSRAGQLLNNKMAADLPSANAAICQRLPLPPSSFPANDRVKASLAVSTRAPPLHMTTTMTSNNTKIVPRQIPSVAMRANVALNSVENLENRKRYPTNAAVSSNNAMANSVILPSTAKRQSMMTNNVNPSSKPPPSTTTNTSRPLNNINNGQRQPPGPPSSVATAANGNTANQPAAAVSSMSVVNNSLDDSFYNDDIEFIEVLQRA